jgi:hypothetical protein
MFEVSWGSAVTPTPYAYPNLLNKKAPTPSEHKYHIVRTTFLVFLLMQVMVGLWCIVEIHHKRMYGDGISEIIVLDLWILT